MWIRSWSFWLRLDSQNAFDRGLLKFSLRRRQENKKKYAIILVVLAILHVMDFIISKLRPNNNKQILFYTRQWHYSSSFSSSCSGRYTGRVSGRRFSRSSFALFIWGVLYLFPPWYFITIFRFIR